MAALPGLTPVPPPECQLQRRLHKCPHTGIVRVAFSRVGPVPSNTDVACDSSTSLSAVLRQLHTSKCDARVRQLPRRRLPTVAASAKAAATASECSKYTAAVTPASRSSAPRFEDRRQVARTLAAEQGRGAAISIAQELVHEVLETCIADFGFESLLADGEARVDSADRAVRSTRVHDGCGYLRHAKDRIMVRMTTPDAGPRQQQSPALRMVCTPHEDAAPNSHLHHTPPTEWGFATKQQAGHDDRALTPRAIDAQQQRYARRRIDVARAMDRWDAVTITDAGGAVETTRSSQRPVHNLVQHARSPKALLAARKATGRTRGSAVLTARVWASQSTARPRCMPDPVARPFPFAGTKPFPATVRDQYIYPTVPNHYHLAVEAAVAQTNGNDRPPTPLGEASYKSVQFTQLDRRRVGRSSHMEAAHVAEQLLRSGPSSRWVHSPTGRLVVTSATTSPNAGASSIGVLPTRSAGQAWTAAVEHPLTERDNTYNRGGDDDGGGKLETPLTVRHLLSAGAFRQLIG